MSNMDDGRVSFSVKAVVRRYHAYKDIWAAVPLWRIVVRKGNWQPGRCFRCGCNERWDGCRPRSKEDLLRANFFFGPTSNLDFQKYELCTCTPPFVVVKTGLQQFHRLSTGFAVIKTVLPNFYKCSTGLVVVKTCMTILHGHSTGFVVVKTRIMICYMHSTGLLNLYTQGD